MHGRQVLAVSGSNTEVELRGDDAFFDALLAGAHVENAAIAAGISVRTAYRRLADPAFRQRVEDARESLRASILSKLTDAASDAIDCLWELAREAEPGVRVRAAKALLDSLLRAQGPTNKGTTTVRYSVTETSGH